LKKKNQVKFTKQQKSDKKMKMTKPEATPIREETKKILKARAAIQGLSLVDYLELILREYFNETDKGNINEKIIIERLHDET
jgi:hypothetical protein